MLDLAAVAAEVAVAEEGGTLVAGPVVWVGNPGAVGTAEHHIAVEVAVARTAVVAWVAAAVAGTVAWAAVVAVEEAVELVQSVALAE